MLNIIVSTRSNARSRSLYALASRFSISEQQHSVSAIYSCTSTHTGEINPTCRGVDESACTARSRCSYKTLATNIKWIKLAPYYLHKSNFLIYCIFFWRKRNIMYNVHRHNAAAAVVVAERHCRRRCRRWSVFYHSPLSPFRLLCENCSGGRYAFLSENSFLVLFYVYASAVVCVCAACHGEMMAAAHHEP